MSIEHEHRKCSDGGKTLLALNVGNGWEWMGMGVAGIIIDSYCGSFPHCLLSTSSTSKRNIHVFFVHRIFKSLNAHEKHPSFCTKPLNDLSSKCA